MHLSGRHSWSSFWVNVRNSEHWDFLASVYTNICIASEWRRPPIIAQDHFLVYDIMKKCFQVYRMPEVSAYLHGTISISVWLFRTSASFFICWAILLMLEICHQQDNCRQISVPTCLSLKLLSTIALATTPCSLMHTRVCKEARGKRYATSLVFIRGLSEERRWLC